MEAIKVSVITLVSPQTAPAVMAFRDAKKKDLIRYGVRGLLSALYGLMVALL